MAAIFALSSKDANQKFVLLAYFPVVLFWAMDAFFLRQEKLFRKLYEKVANNQVVSELFTLDTARVDAEVPGIICVFFSKTLLPFHGSIVGVVLFAMICLI